MADQKDIKSYILWYDSKSHLKTRYFVGLTMIPCPRQDPHCTGHTKPSWSYEKDGATILDGVQGGQAKQMCEAFGYTGLVLEPIDETPAPAISKPEGIPVH